MAKDNRNELNVNEKIGENLRLLRQVVGLSQRDLADILGVSYQQVCSAARGLRISVTWFENFLPC
ncbi:helix-turn-helix domain-containing protein [Micavibrio aeruginosavorus]|uniref:helix-turn-helix domain-containing protein n=1 Tax=Micavibrio aeruginosavorus TaxID=349221 RepID=UPI003F4AC767